jgi:hypothetical protein
MIRLSFKDRMLSSNLRINENKNIFISLLFHNTWSIATRNNETIINLLNRIVNKE